MRSVVKGDAPDYILGLFHSVCSGVALSGGGGVVAVVVVDDDDDDRYHDVNDDNCNCDHDYY